MWSYAHFSWSHAHFLLALSGSVAGLQPVYRFAMIASVRSLLGAASSTRASHLFAPRRGAHDSFAALNIMKDPAAAPVEKVGPRVPSTAKTSSVVAYILLFQ